VEVKVPSANCCEGSRPGAYSSTPATQRAHLPHSLPGAQRTRQQLRASSPKPFDPYPSAHLAHYSHCPEGLISSYTSALLVAHLLPTEPLQALAHIQRVLDKKKLTLGLFLAFCLAADHTFNPTHNFQPR
jgi:hypothetical protein